MLFFHLEIMNEGGKNMFFGIITLLIAILCVLGLIKSFKNRNYLAVGYAAIASLVFGWFSIMTIINSLFPEEEALLTLLKLL